MYYTITPKFLQCGNDLTVSTESRHIQTYCNAASSEEPQWNRAEVTTPWTWENLVIQFQTDSAGASKFWLQVEGKEGKVFLTPQRARYFRAEQKIGIKKRFLSVLPSMAAFQQVPGSSVTTPMTVTCTSTPAIPPQVRKLFLHNVLF